MKEMGITIITITLIIIYVAFIIFLRDSVRFQGGYSISEEEGDDLDNLTSSSSEIEESFKIISKNSSNGTGIANDLDRCPNRFGMARSWPVEPLMPIGGMVALPLAISAFQRVVGTSEAPLFISCL